jgi:hypothetical protein
MHIAFRGRPLGFGTLVVTGVAVFAGLVGCAHRPAPVAEAPDTVGTLAPSYHSIAVAPVHATTDFGHAEIVETGHGPEAASPAETVVAPAATGPDASQPPAEMGVAPVATGMDDSLPPAKAETPDVVAKTAHGF